MLDTTSRLSLPLIAAAQAQKHVTHNEALTALDSLVHLSVIDRTLTSPPASPVVDARHIVAPSPTGAWTGQAGLIAVFEDGVWRFMQPRAGWVAWVQAEQRLVVHDGTGWTNLPLGPLSQLGVNATADTTNRLSVASSASLFNHNGTDHRLTINKQATSATASQIFSTNFSGRAEIGLMGSDALQFKTSPDGTTYRTALVAEPAGVVRLPENAQNLFAMTGPLSPALATGSWVPVTTTETAWSQLIARPAALLDMTNSQFKPLVGGRYRVSASVTFYTGSVGSHVYASLWRNGTQIPGSAQVTTIDAALSFGALNVSILTDLVPGDQVGLRVYSSAAGVKLLNGGFGWFSLEFAP